jgi:acetolactate synthase-1/3 small subunit
MKHVITAIVENQPGVLARIVGLISGRGFNIESLNVAPTQDPTVSSLTMTVPGDDRVLEQVMKQLNKLIDVIRVNDLTRKRYLNRELVLVEIAATPSKRAEILSLADLCRARVVAVHPKSLTLQLGEEEERIHDFLDLLKPYRILDVSRSGVIAVQQVERSKEEG